MVGEPSPDQIIGTRLDDETIIYRAARNRAWLTDDKQKGTDLAFHRHPLDDPHPDPDGLSFGRTPQDAVRGFRYPVPGIIRVRVGDLRKLRIKEDLDKELEIVEDKPGHAIIPNLPFYDESDFIELKKAIRWAEIIAETSEVRPEDQLSRSYWRGK